MRIASAVESMVAEWCFKKTVIFSISAPLDCLKCWYCLQSGTISNLVGLGEVLDE